MLRTEISPETCSRLFLVRLGHCACSLEQNGEVNGCTAFCFA